MQKQEDRPETWSGLAKGLPVLCLPQGSLADQELIMTKNKVWGFLTAGSSTPEQRCVNCHATKDFAIN